MERSSWIMIFCLFCCLAISQVAFGQSYNLRYDSQTADTLYLTLVIYTPPQPLPGTSFANFYFNPWWGVAVDGANPWWQATPGYFSYGFVFGTYSYFPIAWPITVPEGNHSFQAYLIIEQDCQYYAVGNPLVVPICEHSYEMMDWELIVYTANNQGLNMRLRAYNNTSQTWNMNWDSQPIACFSINGNMVYGTPIQEPLEITLYPSLTYFIALPYLHPLSDGIYKLQAYLILPDEGGLVPVGEQQTVNLGNVQCLGYGPGDLPANLPIDFAWTNSLFECIYTSAELGGLSGTITSLALYNAFQNPNFSNVPVKVFLGSTNRTDLMESWIPSTELSLVYEGNLSFPMGQNQILFNLDTPFNLPQGQNLVLMVQREGTAGCFTFAESFLCQTSDPFNGRLATAMITGLDPANPPENACTTGKTPKLDIYYLPGSEVSDHVSHPYHQLSCYPNPFNDRASLSFELKEPSRVRVDVYNLKGQKVRTLLNGTRVKGNQIMAWDGCDDSGTSTASGIYLLQLIVDGRPQTTVKLVKW